MLLAVPCAGGRSETGRREVLGVIGVLVWEYELKCLLNTLEMSLTTFFSPIENRKCPITQLALLLVKYLTCVAARHYRNSRS